MKLEGLGTRLIPHQVVFVLTTLLKGCNSVNRNYNLVTCVLQLSQGYNAMLYINSTLLKMGRYYNTTMRHYWDMSVK